MNNKEKRSARIEEITRQLTSCFSVSETAGEAQMGDIIYAMLAIFKRIRKTCAAFRSRATRGDASASSL